MSIESTDESAGTGGPFSGDCCPLVDNGSGARHNRLPGTAVYVYE